MALSLRSLVRKANQAPVGAVAGTPTARQVSDFDYATDDAAAVVEAANYFNGAVRTLRVGDKIDARMAMGGTPVYKSYVVTANNGTAVTIALQATTAG